MRSTVWRIGPTREQTLAGLLVVVTVVVGCGRPPRATPALRADVPLHLEERLDAVVVEGSELPEEAPEPVVWRFDEPQPDWKLVGYRRPNRRLPRIEYVDDAVRLSLSDERRPEGWRQPHGGYYVDLPGWDLEDWAYVMVELRSSEPVHHFELGINLSTGLAADATASAFEGYSPEIPVIDDGAVHRYIARLDRFGENPPQGAWRQLGVYVGAEEPATVDLLSVTVVPKEADFATRPVGTRMTVKGGEHRRAIYVHGSSRLEYRVAVPKAATIDLGLGVLRRDRSVRFRLVAVRADTEPATLLEETHFDPRSWAMQSVDLSSFEGETVALRLETEADAGTVGLWASPVLSGRRGGETNARPNVILYIIDGAGADYMSLYGYNRTTTPFLRRLAEQGASFERAYSSSTWTKPSTASFMTSVPHSALGGFRSKTDRVPEGAQTMAEALHAAGYQTAVIVSNPYAASLSGLERGADYMHETGVEPNNSESSRLLHESFWRWRAGHPAEPYWVHFQSTDIHEPFRPVAPFSGLFVDPKLRKAYEQWDPHLYPGGGWRDPVAYEEHGIDRARYAHAQQGLYDEAMAHNDHRIGELVARLEERGEWRNTLLIVAADHGYPAACHRLMDPLPPIWKPMFNAHETHVPMLFVWPGRIAAGRSFSAPVSMLDLMPTVLDLLGLPVPETARGRSLAPLLLQRGAWEPRPIILDEFFLDDQSGELHGLVEVVDGWWGASLEVGAGAANDIGGTGAQSDERRPAPLLLYDLRADPFTLHSLHEEHPELVAKYTRLLERQLAAHLELGKHLGEGGQVAVGQEQLEALRALGYLD